MARKTSNKKTTKKPIAEKKEASTIKKPKMDQESTQLAWIIGFIVLIAAAFLIGYFYFQSLKTFDFAGVKWDKEKYGQLELYHSIFPISYQGVFKHNYNIYLRNDPRENAVSINLDKIDFYPEIIISNSIPATQCKDAARVVADLSMFTSALPFVKNISGALADKQIAEELNTTFADCSSAVNKTVILIQTSDSPLIERQGDCYTLNIGNNCQNALVVEKFEIQMIKQLFETK